MLWAPTGGAVAPWPGVISMDGTAEYISTGTSLTMARIGDRTLVERIALPIYATSMLMAPSGRWVLAFGRALGNGPPGPRVTRVDLP
jgi:hypothetical protein